MLALIMSLAIATAATSSKPIVAKGAGFTQVEGVTEAINIAVVVVPQTGPMTIVFNRDDYGFVVAGDWIRTSEGRARLAVKRASVWQGKRRVPDPTASGTCDFSFTDQPLLFTASCDLRTQFGKTVVSFTGTP